MICPDDNFTTFAICPMLSVKRDCLINTSLNFFLIVPHKLVKCYFKEISQRLKKCNVGIGFATLPLAYRGARDVHCNRKLLLRNIFG